MNGKSQLLYHAERPGALGSYRPMIKLGNNSISPSFIISMFFIEAKFNSGVYK